MRSERLSKRSGGPIIDISWELESREHSCSKEDEVHIGIAQARSLCAWFEMGLVRISKASMATRMHDEISTAKSASG